LPVVYDFYNDHCEVNAMVVASFHLREAFRRVHNQHELRKKRHPDLLLTHAPPRLRPGMTQGPIRRFSL